MKMVSALEARMQPGTKSPGFTRRLADSASLSSNILVIKISGKLCDSSQSLTKLAGEVRELVERGSKIVLVHGGGKQIDAALAQTGITTEKIDGIRVTSEEAMEIIGQVVSDINKGIVSAFGLGGLTATGVDGFGCPLIKGKPWMKRTGTIDSVDTATLLMLLKKTDVIVLSCLGKDDAGLLNINADSVAQAVSVSVKAKKLILLSDVGGVFQNLEDSRTLMASVTMEGVEGLISTGAITGGMIPKARACKEAVQNGVGEVILAADSVSLIDVIAAKEPGCTRFIGSGQGIC